MLFLRRLRREADTLPFPDSLIQNFPEVFIRTLHHVSRAFSVATAFGWLLCPVAKPQASEPAAKKLKIYISVDMEGVAGVVTGDQLGPGGFEYERFRHF